MKGAFSLFLFIKALTDSIRPLSPVFGESDEVLYRFAVKMYIFL